MTAVAVVAVVAAAVLALTTGWLVVDRRRAAARVEELADRADRARRDIAADLSARALGAEAPLDGPFDDEPGALPTVDPLARLDRSTEALADLAGRAADMRARSLRALDAIPQGVVICDLAGTVIARNVDASAWVGARHGEALVQVAVDEMLTDAAAGRPDHRTIELVGPPSRTVVLTATPVAGGAVVVIDDVSERRRVDALRRDFVANISHEMRTPVGALSLLAETLLTETELLSGQPGSAVVQRLAARLYHEALRLGRTIDDLLELSRIEAGEPPSRDPVPLADVIAAAVDRTAPAAELREVTLQVDLPDPTALAWGDRRQLVSALANLVDNAVKYSDPGGVVDLFAATDSTGEARFVVRDHGIGIPEVDRDRVFERFYRVDRARRRDTGGTGLGLAIVRHVAINHGGDVEVHSREGEGSSFTLRLPAAHVAGGSATAPPATDPPIEPPAIAEPTSRGALS